MLRVSGILRKDLDKQPFRGGVVAPAERFDDPLGEDRDLVGGRGTDEAERKHHEDGDEREMTHGGAGKSSEA